MPTKPLDFDTVRALALALPGVEEGTIHGAPSWKVRGKLLACPALHRSAEPDTLAVRLDFEQRARRLADAPRIYYVTEHYLKHPIVLARLARLDRNALKDLLALAWRLADPKPKPTRRKARKPSRLPLK
jgi:hypothetical protein